MRIKGSKTLKNRGLLSRSFFQNGIKNSVEPNFLQFFLIDNQWYIRKMKNNWKKCLRNGKKVVLLHPLSERMWGLNEGTPGASSLKVWGQHKTRRHREAAPGIGTYNKGTPKRTSRRNPRFRRKIQVQQYYNEEFDPGSGWTLAAGLIHASRTVNAPSGAWEWRTGA